MAQNDGSDIIRALSRSPPKEPELKRPYIRDPQKDISISIL